MRTASLAVVAALLAAPLLHADEPEPPSLSQQQLLLELTLPHVGLPSLGKVKRPTPNLKGIDQRLYRDKAKADSPVRKAVRAGQVALWACSHEPAPVPLQAEVVALRKRLKIDPTFLKVRYPIPSDRDAESRFKTDAYTACKGLCRLQGVIEDALDNLKTVEAQADNEGPRWQAHVALVKLWLLRRLVSLEEHQAALGRLRKDLPDYDAKKDTAWQLVSTEALHDVSSKKYAKDAEKLAEQITKAHKDTPWDKLAHEALKAKLGANWQGVK